MIQFKYKQMCQKTMYYGVQLLHMPLTRQNAGFIPCHVEYVHTVP